MENEDQIKKAVSSLHSIRAFYIFGSRATGSSSATSDYDFAFLADRSLNAEQLVELRLELFACLTSILRSDQIDIVCLNNVSSAALSFAVVQDGILLLDRDPELAQFELNVKHDYFDHIAALRRNGFEVD